MDNVIKELRKTEVNLDRFGKRFDDLLEQLEAVDGFSSSKPLKSIVKRLHALRDRYDDQIATLRTAQEEIETALEEDDEEEDDPLVVDEVDAASADDGDEDDELDEDDDEDDDETDLDDDDDEEDRAAAE